MNKWDTVAILGVGLIGGSLGRALLDRKLARRVIGIGRRLASLSKAKQVGAVSETTLDLARGVAGAELIVVCTPVDQIVEHVRAVSRACPEGALITDVGSTKGRIVAELPGPLDRGVTFVGSHPLAGSERRGPAESDPRLFEGRTVLVTPGPQSPPASLARVKALWRAVGAKVQELDPEAHDQALAATSHLPHLVAAALAAATPPELLPLSAGGWRDTTRVAAGDPELWQAILSENRLAVLAALDRLEGLLGQFARALAADQADELHRLLTAGQRVRQRLKTQPAPQTD